MMVLVAHQVGLLSRHLTERTEENHEYSLSVYFFSLASSIKTGSPE